MSCVYSTYHFLRALNSLPSSLQRISLALPSLLLQHALPRRQLFFLLFALRELFLLSCDFLARPEHSLLSSTPLEPSLQSLALPGPFSVLAPPALSSLPHAPCACFLPYPPILVVPRSSAPLALLLPIALSSLPPLSLSLLLALAIAFSFFPPLALSCFTPLPASPLPAFLLLSLALAVLPLSHRPPCLAPFGPAPPLSPSSLAVFLCGQILLLCLSSITFPFVFPAGLVRPTLLISPSDDASTSSACPYLCRSNRHLRLACVFRSRLPQLLFFAETHLLALLLFHVLPLLCLPPLLLLSSPPLFLLFVPSFSPCFNRLPDSTFQVLELLLARHLLNARQIVLHFQLHFFFTSFGHALDVLLILFSFL